MVFTFNNVEGGTTEVLSYLAGGADVYTTDADGNRIFTDAAKQIDAGYAEGTYDTYLKYVSFDDLKQYGATPTGTLNDDGAMTFSWGNESNWGNENNGLKTADYRPLTQLDGETIVTTPGWYDFTRKTTDGDGAEYITYKQTDPTTGEEITRIVGRTKIQ